MFRAFGKLFRKEESPKEPFVDPVFGQFTFERDLGWKKRIAPGETSAELVLGSDGGTVWGPPSGVRAQLVDCAPMG